MTASTFSPQINPPGGRNTIRVAYQHDLGSVVTAYAGYDFKTGKTFEQELPTSEFLALMQDIANRCRVEAVRP